MLHFRLFGIPVVIHPSLWIVLAILGGGLRLGGVGFELMPMVMFMVAAFLSLMVHELGHALVGRGLCGSRVAIEMACMGGACLSVGGRVSRWTDIARTAAGPGFALLFGLVFVGILSQYLVDPSTVWRVTWQWILNEPVIEWYHAIAWDRLNPYMYYFLNYSIFVASWWSAFNLLPIFPMDGGQILGNLVRSRRTMHLVGMLTAAGVALVALTFEWWIAAAFLGYFSFLNYKMFQEYSR